MCMYYMMNGILTRNPKFSAIHEISRKPSTGTLTLALANLKFSKYFMLGGITVQLLSGCIHLYIMTQKRIGLYEPGHLPNSNAA